MAGTKKPPADIFANQSVKSLLSQKINTGKFKGTVNDLAQIQLFFRVLSSEADRLCALLIFVS